MTDGIRWAVRPFLYPKGLLQSAPPPRRLEQVRPPIPAWGNAMRLDLEHTLELQAMGLPALAVRS